MMQLSGRRRGVDGVGGHKLVFMVVCVEKKPSTNPFEFVLEHAGDLKQCERHPPQ